MEAYRCRSVSGLAHYTSHALLVGGGMQRRRNGSTTSLGAGRGRRAGQGGWVGRGMGGAGELRVPGARRRASPSARTCHNVWGLTAQTLLPAQTWCHAPRGAGAPGVVNKAQRAGVRACTKQTGDGGTGCRPLHLPPPPPSSSHPLRHGLPLVRHHRAQEGAIVGRGEALPDGQRDVQQHLLGTARLALGVGVGARGREGGGLVAQGADVGAANSSPPRPC